MQKRKILGKRKSANAQGLEGSAWERDDQKKRVLALSVCNINYKSETEQ